MGFDLIDDYFEGGCFLTGRCNDDLWLEPRIEFTYGWKRLPCLEVNVTVRVKMKGMDTPILLSRNYLPEYKIYNAGEMSQSVQKAGAYKHTELYNYQMKRIDDLLALLEGNNDYKYKDYNYIPLAGSPVTWKSCGYENLFNGDTYEGGWEPFNSNSDKVNGVWYAEFKSRQPITPSKYTMVTSFNASYYPQYNPKSWKVYAKESLYDKWRTIATVTNDNRLSGNAQRFEYPLDVTGRLWQYFRLEISENHGGAMMQLAEFEFDDK